MCSTIRRDPLRRSLRRVTRPYADLVGLKEIRRRGVLSITISLKPISEASLLLCDNRRTGNAGKTKHPLIALNLTAAAQHFFKIV